ncbi:MAG: polyphosphate kinase 1 [Actinomycetia bacterium]|nr:polyphosphate kinase 1 [Actinomycetes bacterium]
MAFVWRWSFVRGGLLRSWCNQGRGSHRSVQCRSELCRCQSKVGGERRVAAVVSTGIQEPEREQRYVNRELSWLDFNARVLAMAEDDSVPLLDRAMFVAIFTDNLDEFFQVRVAGLKEQVAVGITTTTPDGLTPRQQLEAIQDRTQELIDCRDRLFLTELVPGLEAHGVAIIDLDDLSDSDQVWLDDVWERRMFPILTPLAVDPGHPFPYISDLSLNLGVVVRDPETGDRHFARIKVPNLLDRFVELPGRTAFVPLEQVIASRVHTLFPGMDIIDAVAFRVTRNADLDFEEEGAEDLLEAITLELSRRRFGQAIRLQVEQDISPETLELLLRELDLESTDVFVHEAPLDLGGLWSIYRIDRPDLKSSPWHPITEPRLQRSAEVAPDIFSELRRGDILLHHPYSSFATSVQEFIRQASLDDHVVAIKVTLYRTSGDGEIVEWLVRAAERGIQVAVVVELKARFDEENNIEWAKQLEQAGVHVAYGLVGLKVHTKTTLVVRDEPDGLRRYCHVGTGNYNARTANLYEDLGLLTADRSVGADLTQLFNYLTGYGRDVSYERLLVAPQDLRGELMSRIDREIESENGRIIMKMNSLVDIAMIDRLYVASQAGVEIDLVVRGICCLRPGVPGLSDNIRVRSIIGRFLEHSRIYYFANGSGSGRPSFHMGSADLMPRNLNRRVEVLTSIEGPSLQGRLWEILELNLADDTLAWEVDTDGDYNRLVGRTIDTHRRLRQLATARVADHGGENEAVRLPGRLRRIMGRGTL